MKVYYINSTHWDREWYIPFQGFRYNLVEMVDGLLDIMERDPEYKTFCFDGQTIVLEDYVQVVPEGAPRLKKLIGEGRLKIGPWYVMPDEFLVSGESLIRNLMTGHEIARKWGAQAWKYGYVCDIFGHIAQLPQIFQGFDIHGTFVSRGLGKAKFSHFLWKAPNGAKCYGTIGQYGSFTRRTLGKFHTEEFPEMLKRHISMISKKSDVPIVVFSNTDDHAKATAHTPQLIKLIGQLFPEAEVVDADLSHLPEELRRYESILPIVCGELNDPCAGVAPGGCAELLPHCLSSYYPLKQENDRCQNLLERQVEPMLAISAIDGQPIRHSFVDLAYRYLLQNHPHDSICGCSADQVHKDMIYRFDQVKEISQRLKERFLEFRPDGNGKDYELRIYNFSGHPRKGIQRVNAELYLDSDAVADDAFVLLNGSGEEIPFQILSVARNVPKRILNLLQTCKNVNVYTLCFDAQIPAFGYTTYRIVPAKTSKDRIQPIPYGENWIDNGVIRLEIRPNGRLDILDKRNGKRYQKLHGFTDDAEGGDGWMHEVPSNNYCVDDSGDLAVIRCVTAGFAAVTFRVEKTMRIPGSDCKMPLEIAYEITVKKDSAVVEIDLQVDNTVQDHRLRLMLPSGIAGDTYFAGQAFYCVQRKTGVTPGSEKWPEPECHEKNMDGIFGKRDSEGHGLAFLSAEGLHECGAYDDSDHTLAVTLFRSFGNVYLNRRSEQAQLQGVLRFRYGIMALDENVDYPALLDARHDLARMDLSYCRHLGSDEVMQAARNYFTLDNRVVRVSVFKCAQNGDGYILRLYNASDASVNGNLTLNFACSHCKAVNLNEEDLSDVPVEAGKIAMSFAPWEIKTFRFS